MWSASFGRGFGPVVRQTAKWMNEETMVEWEKQMKIKQSGKSPPRNISSSHISYKLIRDRIRGTKYVLTRFINWGIGSKQPTVHQC